MLTGKDLEDLWFDDGFDGALARLAQKKKLPPDDLKQAVFLEITESDALTKAECRRAAWRVAQRMGDDAAEENEVLSQEELEANGFELSNGTEYDNCSSDGTFLSRQDQMISDLIGIFQPTATRDIQRGRLLVNGAPL